MAYRWIPIIGEFAHEGDDIIFKGKERETSPDPGDASPRIVPSLGIYISDRLTGDGVISADITFETVTPGIGLRISRVIRRGKQGTAERGPRRRLVDVRDSDVAPGSQPGRIRQMGNIGRGRRPR